MIQYNSLTVTFSNSQLNSNFNPNKAGIFEGIFLWGVNLNPPPSFIFQEELI